MKKLLFLIFLLLVIVVGGFLFFFKQSGSNLFTDRYETFQVIVEGTPVKKEYFSRVDGQYYFSTDMIAEYLDSSIQVDTESNSVLLNNRVGNKVMPIGEDTMSINGGVVGLRDPLYEEDGKVFVPIEAFIYDYEVEVRYNKDKNVLVMDYDTVAYAKAHPSGDGVNMREGNSIDESIVNTLNKDDELYVYGEEDGWYNVREITGYAGWIRGDNLEVETIEGDFISELPEEEWVKNSTIDKPINITWDYTYGKVSEETINAITPIEGLDVMIPTWFSIDNAEGKILDRGDPRYVQAYNELGIDVWGYVDNKFDSDLTHAFLTNDEARANAVQELLRLTKSYGLKGLNIDFENTQVEDRDLITQFVTEIYEAFSPEGLIVSIDVTPKLSDDIDQEFYDRAALSKVSDYIILMAYDQHWSKSEVAGSVAEYKWVEGNINRLIRDIPQEKFILSIPFYSRIWSEEEDGAESRTAGMTDMHEFVQAHELQPTWDGEAKQRYVESNNEKLWIEDSESIMWKTSLVRKYNLAGVSSWRYGFETPEIWTTISQQLSYYQYPY